MRNFLTETATVERLGTAIKTKREHEIIGEVTCSKPQTKFEENMLNHTWGQVTYIYSGIDSDIKQNDYLTISEIKYLVQEVIGNDFGNISYLKIKCLKKQ